MSDRSQITIAQKAAVSLGAVGSTAPTDLSPLLGTEYHEVGLFTPDSLGFNTDPSFEEVRSHQSNYPTRRFQTEDAATLSVDLQQWNGRNFKAVYGGGTIEQVSVDPEPKVYRFTPPAIGAREATAAIVDLQDGPKKYRRIIPVSEQSEGVEQTFEKTSESILPLRLSVLGGDVGDAWYDYTNDEGFAPEPVGGP